MRLEALARQSPGSKALDACNSTMVVVWDNPIALRARLLVQRVGLFSHAIGASSCCCCCCCSNAGASQAHFPPRSPIPGC